jgi:hypothetical protein
MSGIISTSTRQLRTAVAGLTCFAAAEEELLLLAALPAGEQPPRHAAGSAEPGSPACWSAAAIVAHSTEFKQQQVQRLQAVHRGETPPAFAETDHLSAEVYRRYSRQAVPDVTAGSREVTAALLDGLSATSDEDLLDPARNPWLAGRQLWLQVIVRGFWHPLGHIAEYYLGHGAPDRACALQSQAVEVAGYLNAPGMARGMAQFSLACARARSGYLDDALAALRQSIELNPDLRARAGGEADLAPLRDGGRLAALLAS